MKIGFVVPHFYMWDKILQDNIFAPAPLALDLTEELTNRGHEVTMFTTGPVETSAKLKTADLELIEKELAKHNKSLDHMIKEDLSTFHKIFKVIELEILSNAFSQEKKFDVIHVYVTNGPEGPIFAKNLTTPIIFTLHDPLKLNFPNPESFSLIRNINFTSISNNQKSQAPGLNIIKTIYHGIDFEKFEFNDNPKDYFLSFGRIVKPKGVHHAIDVCRKTNSKLKIAGMHYEGHGGDNYFSEKIQPHLDSSLITYEGYVKDWKKKINLWKNAKALLFPLQWNEPFGMVLIELTACGTPVIAFDNGSVPEIIKDGVNGFIVKNKKEMIEAMKNIDKIDRKKCREYTKSRFQKKKMVDEYENLYYEVCK